MIYSSFLLLGPWGGPASLGVWAAVLIVSFTNSALRTRHLAEITATLEWNFVLKRYFWIYVFLGPLMSLVTLQGAVRAVLSRRIRWRGKVYEMRSPTETFIR